MPKYDAADFENLAANLPNCIDCQYKRMRSCTTKRGLSALEYYCSKHETKLTLPFSAQHSIPEWCPIKLEFEEEKSIPKSDNTERSADDLLRTASTKKLMLAMFKELYVDSGALHKDISITYHEFTNELDPFGGIIRNKCEPYIEARDTEDQLLCYITVSKLLFNYANKDKF